MATSSAAKSGREFSSTFLSPEAVSQKRQNSETRLVGIADVSGLVERLKSKDVDRVCPKCNKVNNNNKIYCYTCLVLVGNAETNCVPRVELPIKLDILRHPKELKTKSTALHAQVICRSDQVRTVELPQVDELTGIDPETTLLLFPTKDAKLLEEIPDLDKIQRVVVIDSTWQQANAVLRSELCQKLTRRVKLGQSHETSFWRHQRKGSDHLATIEAIYYFFRERYEVLNCGNKEYDGRYDNLLYIFVGLLRLIEDSKKNPSETAVHHSSRSSSGDDEEVEENA